MLALLCQMNRDGRDKPGHDALSTRCPVERIDGSERAYTTAPHDNEA
jgi:hypothetical protein